ncbi:MAG: cation:proton antiporter [candidate division WOR-3 bacterium]
MENNIVEIVLHLVIQIAFILFVAKIFAEIFERFLKQPPVLGELIAGIIIGPYLLGNYISIPKIGHLFPNIPHSNIPVSNELYAIGQIAVIILLFISGLETDFSLFLKFAGPSFLVASAGVILPFIFGNVLTVIFGFADNFLSPTALFMGAVLTATSVGITARILSDLGKLNTPEGVTILASAVIDDVLGILVLTIVIGIIKSGSVSAVSIFFIALKALGIWLLILIIGILISKPFVKILKKFKTDGARIAFSLFLCFLGASIAEYFGLAMIIGAYAIGLAFSQTEIKHELIESLKGVYHFLVPLFFVIMGMMVDIKSMIPVLLFGGVISIAAIIGKVFGCGLTALIPGFNILGGARIGFGMLPRGEVALIIASIAIAQGAIERDMYGVAVMMTAITTLLAPVCLVYLFKIEKEGIRKWKR